MLGNAVIERNVVGGEGEVVEMPKSLKGVEAGAREDGQSGHPFTVPAPFSHSLGCHSSCSLGTFSGPVARCLPHRGILFQDSPLISQVPSRHLRNCLLPSFIAKKLEFHTIPNFHIIPNNKNGQPLFFLIFT